MISVADDEFEVRTVAELEEKEEEDGDDDALEDVIDELELLEDVVLKVLLILNRYTIDAAARETTRIASTTMINMNVVEIATLLLLLRALEKLIVAATPQ